MFERFTREARRVVTGAADEARQRGDHRVGTEHLLIGVASSTELPDPWPNANALRAELDRLEADALRWVGLDPDLLANVPTVAASDRGTSHLPFTGGAKDILKGALQEAIAYGHRHIGVEHIALALTREKGPDRALAILEGLGAAPEDLRDSLIRRMRKAS